MIFMCLTKLLYPGSPTPQSTVWFGRSYLHSNLSLFWGSPLIQQTGLINDPGLTLDRRNPYLFMGVCDREELQGRPTKDPLKGKSTYPLGSTLTVYIKRYRHMPRKKIEEVYLTRQYEGIFRELTAGVPFDLPILSPAVAAFGFSCQQFCVNKLRVNRVGAGMADLTKSTSYIYIFILSWYIYVYI